MSSPLSPRAAENRGGAAENRGGAALFVAAIFASAFLIFLVQPMVGKRILPWFGGVPAVWTLCLAFYQVTLFLGYAYAHALSRFAPVALHPWIHAGAIAGAMLSLPVLPGAAWQPQTASDPSLRILAMLAANVALPFLVLASTGPLVQLWFALRFPTRSPYALYAVSNFGSLLALVAYPIVIEPRLGLSRADPLWSSAFALTALGVLGCAVLARGAGRTAVELGTVPSAADRSKPTPGTIALWLGLSASAVTVLMAITSKLCLDVASVPFLWILPLSTYLVTFIVCFASERAYHRAGSIGLSLVALLAVGGARHLGGWLDPKTMMIATSLPVQIGGYCALLFGVCMVMHGELYRLRPAPRSLTAFYLCVSGGGAIGGLFVGIVAPLLFVDYYEFELGLAVALVLLLTVRFRRPAGAEPAATPRWRAPVAGTLSLVWLTLLAGAWIFPVSDVILQERGFFGVVRVIENNAGTDRASRSLRHGSTMHGIQFTRESIRHEPTTYYGRITALGTVLSDREPGAATRIGVIGLGIGTLASYGRAGDTIRFYEIDPNVVRIARDSGLFSFLDNSEAEIEYALGDARTLLEEEQAHGVTQEFDVLVVDAFSSDAVPVHLLTREAFEIYSAALAPDGLLAIHGSNRHFTLPILAARMGWEAGFGSLQVRTGEEPASLSITAKWVLLHRDRKRLRSIKRSLEQAQQRRGGLPRALWIRQPQPVELKHVPVWTDDYSDLFSLLVAR